MRNNKKLIEDAAHILSDPKALSPFIDHTLLKPDATILDILKLCEEAKSFSFKAVCVNPNRVALAKTFLESSKVLLASVVGFPLGAHISAIKAREAKFAISSGASEIDMVMNLGLFKDKSYDEVAIDIRSVVNTCANMSAYCKVKVIIETGLLTQDEIRTACKICEDSGAHFVKTSTGFLGRGASLEDIQIMRESVSEKMEIKASGGIRDLKFAAELIAAGASRLGTSSGVQLIQALPGSQGY